MFARSTFMFDLFIRGLPNAEKDCQIAGNSVGINGIEGCEFCDAEIAALFAVCIAIDAIIDDPASLLSSHPSILVILFISSEHGIGIWPLHNRFTRLAIPTPSGNQQERKQQCFCQEQLEAISAAYSTKSVSICFRDTDPPGYNRPYRSAYPSRFKHLSQSLDEMVKGLGRLEPQGVVSQQYKRLQAHFQ